MLAYIRCGKTSGTSAYSYLTNPDISNNQLLTRGRGETAGFLCDKEIKLTEELKLYLRYFGNKIGHKTFYTITSFSEIPIKEELC